MTSSIRSIRGIERSTAFSPIQPISPYAYYPYRDGETQLPPYMDNDLNNVYEQAANSLATWLQSVKEAKGELERISWQLGRQLRAGVSIDESINKIPHLLNDLEYQYNQHSGDLIPELWDRIEQALEHPASKMLALHRSQETTLWTIQSVAVKTFHQSIQIKRLLLGSDGLLTRLRDALQFADYQKAADLVQPHIMSSLPYTAYYGSLQSYMPLPNAGLIFNQSL